MKDFDKILASLSSIHRTLNGQLININDIEQLIWKNQNSTSPDSSFTESTWSIMRDSVDSLKQFVNLYKILENKTQNDQNN